MVAMLLLLGVSNMSTMQVLGFQTFVTEAFATNCCLYSVLDKSFEFRDANTVSPFFFVLFFGIVFSCVSAVW